MPLVFVSMDFVECATCAAKPGSPTLCASCLHNRAVIGHYQEICQVAIGVVKERRVAIAQARETPLMVKLSKLLGMKY